MVYYFYFYEVITMKNQFLFMTIQEFKDFINNINDKIFKATFKQKASAVEYLTVFLSTIAEQLDLDNLILSDTNFVSDELEEYFSDVIFETTLKNKNLKNAIRVILLFEHKKGINSYFDLYLQLLSYIVMIWKQDRSQRKSPIIVIPLVINQGKKRIAQKTLHDSLKGIPIDFLKYIPQLQYFVLNIQPLDNEPIDEKILNLDSNNILRSLFLSYVAIEQKDKLDKFLIEIFKFYKENPNQKDYFNQLFVFLTNEGYFSSEELKELLKEYLSEKEEKDMLTTAQVWKQEGLQEGLQVGEQKGEQKNARFVIIRGLLKNYAYADLADLTDLPIEQIIKIADDFNEVKAEWHKKNVKGLTKDTLFSEEEIKFIVARLRQMS